MVPRHWRGDKMGTFNGIGTKIYGKAQKRPDGSYVATNWFTFIYFPIIPLHCMRIRAVGTTGFNAIVVAHQKFTYQILESVPMKDNLRQVFLTWLWTLVPIGFLIVEAAIKALRA
jgi:hypothetical protein